MSKFIAINLESNHNAKTFDEAIKKAKGWIDDDEEYGIYELVATVKLTEPSVDVTHVSDKKAKKSKS